MLADFIILSKYSSTSGMEKPVPFHIHQSAYDEMKRQYDAELKKQKSFGVDIKEDKSYINRDGAIITAESEEFRWMITTTKSTIPLADFNMRDVKLAGSGFDFLKDHAGHALGISIYADKVACVECIDCNRTIYSIKRTEEA